MEVGVHAEQFKNNINSRWLDKEMNNVAGNNPKYSIILPARNGFNYLPTCINTIIDQNYNDYELIISDDHSNDGTKQYLNNLSQLASNNLPKYSNVNQFYYFHMRILHLPYQ